MTVEVVGRDARLKVKAHLIFLQLSPFQLVKSDAFTQLSHSFRHAEMEGNNNLCERSVSGGGALTVETVDLLQVWEDAGQVGGAEHQPQLLVEDLVEDLERAQVGRLGGEELCRWRRRRSGRRQGAVAQPRRACVCFCSAWGCWVPYMTAWRSTSFGLSVARSCGETVSRQFWASLAPSSSRPTGSGSRANGYSMLLQGHTHTHTQEE